MNKYLEEKGRAYLKEALAECTQGQQLMFKRMYAKGDLSLEINEVVDKMDVNKIDWAMQQVDRTLNKFKQKKVDLSDLHSKI